MNTPDWFSAFPELSRSNDLELGQLLAEASSIELPTGITVFQSGSPCSSYLLVVSGQVRVQLIAENGRQVVLYRVSSGHSCVLTTSCILAGDLYPAEGVTETPVRAVAISKPIFQRALNTSEIFRQFVFANFSARLAQVIARMEEVAYGSIDARLARVLLEGAPIIKTTQENLALELGSVREVVSRRLNEYKQRGWIQLRRGEIEVIHTDALQQLASGSGHAV